MSTSIDIASSPVRVHHHQWRGALIKRLLYMRSRPLVTLVQVTVPLAFTLLVLYVTGRDPIRQTPPLVLSMSPFGGSVVAVSTNDPPVGAVRRLSQLYARQFNGSRDSVVHVKGSPSGRPRLEQYLMSEAKRDLTAYTYTHYVAAEFLNSTQGPAASLVDVMGFYNYKARHTSAICLSLVDNALLRYHVGSGYSIETTNHPLRAPDAKSHRVTQLLTTGNYLQMSFTLAVVTGLALLMSSFVVAPIEERVSGAKQCQLVAGLRPSVYWGAMFLTDGVVYLAPCVSIVVTLLVWGAVHVGTELWQITALFTLYGWTMLSFIYCLSFYFTDSCKAFAWLTFYNVGSGKEVRVPCPWNHNVLVSVPCGNVRVLMNGNLESNVAVYIS